MSVGSLHAVTVFWRERGCRIIHVASGPDNEFSSEQFCKIKFYFRDDLPFIVYKYLDSILIF